MKKKYFLIIITVILIYVCNFFFFFYNEEKVKAIFWESNNSDEFSLFLNFEDPNKHFYYELKNKEIYKDDTLVATVSGFSDLFGSLEIETPKGNSFKYSRYER